jgi:hypothetical protein
MENLRLDGIEELERVEELEPSVFKGCDREWIQIKENSMGRMSLRKN